MAPYFHTVQYYETDKMGIVHHANYIRWMEEARVYMLEQMGYPFDRIEREGLVCPTVAVSFEYKSSTTFPDRVAIAPRVSSFNGVHVEITYEMTCGDRLVGIGMSRHVFSEAATGRISRLRRDHPELYELLSNG